MTFEELSEIVADLDFPRDGGDLGEAAPRPDEPDEDSCSSGDWYTVAGLDVFAYGLDSGSVVLTVLVRALPCPHLHGIGDLVLREPGHPAEVVLTNGTAACCCQVHGEPECSHTRVVSTIITFADE